MKKSTLIKVAVTLTSILLIFSACSDKKPKKRYDGKKLLEVKCASCHNIEIPPSTFKDEKAPPMMAVAFHIVDFIDADNETNRVLRAKEFVKDYVFNPSANKSFCDKASLESYGVMPSQKGNITPDELDAVTDYIFITFTKDRLMAVQKEQMEFNSLPAGKKLALKHKCVSCHKMNKKMVGPSFNDIALKYKNSENTIEKTILNGSQGKWDSSNGATMPAYKNISKDDLKVLSKWILKSTN